jgi:hypothetical protein
MNLKQRMDFPAVPQRCHEEQRLGFEVLNSFIPVKLHTHITVPYEKSCIFIRRYIILAYLMTFSVNYYLIISIYRLIREYVLMPRKVFI